MAEYRTKTTVEVRQAPSRTSSLFHHLPSGRLVKQLGTKILYSDGIARMSIQPRGWIDQESVERVTGSSAAAAVAAVPSPAKAVPPKRPAKESSEDIPLPPGFEAGPDTPPAQASSPAEIAKDKVAQDTIRIPDQGKAAASEKPAAKREEVAEKAAAPASRSSEWPSADGWQDASWGSTDKWESKDGSSWKEDSGKTWNEDSGNAKSHGWKDSGWSEDSGKTWSENGKQSLRQEDGEVTPGPKPRSESEAKPAEVKSEAEVKSMLGDGRSLTRGRSPRSTRAPEEHSEAKPAEVKSEAEVKSMLGDGRSLTRGRSPILTPAPSEESRVHSEAKPAEVKSEAEVKSMLGDGRSLTRGRPTVPKAAPPKAAPPTPSAAELAAARCNS